MNANTNPNQDPRTLTLEATSENLRYDSDNPYDITVTVKSTAVHPVEDLYLMEACTSAFFEKLLPWLDDVNTRKTTVYDYLERLRVTLMNNAAIVNPDSVSTYDPGLEAEAVSPSGQTLDFTVPDDIKVDQ